MGDHKIHLEINGALFDVRCSCRKMMPKPASREECKVWAMGHMDEVNRVREHLSNRNPPLKSQRDYYLDKANDHHETPENRELWQRLADELSIRLGDAPARPTEQTKIW